MGAAGPLAQCDLGLKVAGEGGSRGLGERKQASAGTTSAWTGRYVKSLWAHRPALAASTALI